MSMDLIRFSRKLEWDGWLTEVSDNCFFLEVLLTKLGRSRNIKYLVKIIISIYFLLIFFMFAKILKNKKSIAILLIKCLNFKIL